MLEQQPQKQQEKREGTEILWCPPPFFFGENGVEHRHGDVSYSPIYTLKRASVLDFPPVYHRASSRDCREISKRTPQPVVV